MFVGHYAPSFVAKRAAPEVPLWLLFVAGQAVDIAWAVLVLLGIEAVRIVPGITAASPLDLYYMPYTHSLGAALLWSAAGAVAYAGLSCRRPRARGAIAIGLVILSHWVLDLLVHRPDLPLFWGGPKVGFGLWNYPRIEFLLEAGLLLGAITWYMRGTRPRTRAGRWALPAFGVALVILQAAHWLGPPPASSRALAFSALLAYGLLAAAGGMVGRTRSRGAAPPHA